MKHLVILLASLVASISLQAQTVIDVGSSGVQDNGTLTGTATITADSVYGTGAVAVPSGSGNHVQLTQPVTDLDMDAGYTYMTWFKQTSPGVKGLIGLGSCCDATEGDARNGYTLNLDGSTTLRYWGGSSANDDNHNLSYSNAAIADGSWHHAAVRVQPGQVDIFFDGVLVATGTESNIPTQPSQASSNTDNAAFVPHIGGDQIDLGADAAVVIDEVRVYGSILTDQEVMDAMNNTGPLPDRLYYTFDDDAVQDDGLVRVQVTKTFSDGSDDEVDVHLSCNSGLPLEQDFTISGGGDGVLFVVTELQGTDTVCEVTESGGPAGYTPVLNGGDGCTWEGVTGGLFTCEITNEANPAEFTVTKDWVVEGAVGEEVLLEAQVTINCTSDILSIDGLEIIEPDGSVTAFLSGDGDSVTVTVDTELGPTSCSASESIFQTGVESESDCGSRSIAAGGSSSCTITNTVFFEGIPTLSQYGMALMALLMLGLGFVGLRRFV
jgi:hypothetical protein